MKVTFELDITNNIKDMFLFGCQFERYPEWITFMKDVEIIRKTDSILGTKIRQKLSFLSIPLNVICTVIEYNEGKSFKLKSDDSPFFIGIDFSVEDLAGEKARTILAISFVKAGPVKFIPDFILEAQVRAFYIPTINKYRAMMDLAHKS